MVVAGGVAANGAIRRALTRFCGESGLRLVLPPPQLCTELAQQEEVNAGILGAFIYLRRQIFAPVTNLMRHDPCAESAVSAPLLQELFITWYLGTRLDFLSDRIRFPSNNLE